MTKDEAKKAAMKMISELLDYADSGHLIRYSPQCNQYEVNGRPFGYDPPVTAPPKGTVCKVGNEYKCYSVYKRSTGRIIDGRLECFVHASDDTRTERWGHWEVVVQP